MQMRMSITVVVESTCKKVRLRTTDIIYRFYKQTKKVLIKLHKIRYDLGSCCQRLSTTHKRPNSSLIPSQFYRFS